MGSGRNGLHGAIVAKPAQLEMKNELAFATAAQNVQGSMKIHVFATSTHVQWANGVSGLLSLHVAKLAALGIRIGPASALAAHVRDFQKTNDPAISTRVRLENGPLGRIGRHVLKLAVVGPKNEHETAPTVQIALDSMSNLNHANTMRVP